MSRDRQCSIPGSQTPHKQNDARVETLLFLGIVFWCWLLVSFFQDRLPWHQAPPTGLYWNGNTLKMTANQKIVEQSENDKSAPAGVTPFLFQPLPINFADAELLTTIRGIGPKLANQIVTTRNARGPFTRPQDLLDVPGIGPSRMEQFAPQFSFAITR